MAVYFVTDGEYVKIGTSVDPRQRIVTLQTASPRPLELLAVVPGDESLEQALHDRYRSARVRGEWFRLGEDDIRDAAQFAEEYRARYSKGPPRLPSDSMVSLDAAIFVDGCRYRVVRETEGLDSSLRAACEQGQVRKYLLLGVLQWIAEHERRASYLEDVLEEVQSCFAGASAQHFVVDASAIMEEMGRVWYSGSVCSETVKRSLQRLLDSRVLEEIR